MAAQREKDASWVSALVRSDRTRLLADRRGDRVNRTPASTGRPPPHTGHRSHRPSDQPGAEPRHARAPAAPAPIGVLGVGGSLAKNRAAGSGAPRPVPRALVTPRGLPSRGPGPLAGRAPRRA